MCTKNNLYYTIEINSIGGILVLGGIVKKNKKTDYNSKIKIYQNLKTAKNEKDIINKFYASKLNYLQHYCSG